MAENGQVLARERIADGLVGVARLHELIASWAHVMVALCPIDPDQ